MKADNLRWKRWNQTVDRALVSGVPEQQIIEVRKLMAIRVLELLTMQIINMSTKSAGKTDEAPAKFEIILPIKQPERFAEATFCGIIL